MATHGLADGHAAGRSAGVSAAMAGIIFLVGFSLFALNMLGAGDVKLLAATELVGRRLRRC